jgi:putative addiction module killer protein
MIVVREYLDAKGRSPFARWFGRLPGPAAAKIRTAIARMETGNLGDTDRVGEGVVERRIDWGPGYRIYFGRDGDELIILLAGGDKKSQADDIKRAKGYWSDYRARKAKE